MNYLEDLNVKIARIVDLNTTSLLDAVMEETGGRAAAAVAFSFRGSSSARCRQARSLGARVVLDQASPPEICLDPHECVYMHVCRRVFIPVVVVVLETTRFYSMRCLRLHEETAPRTPTEPTQQRTAIKRNDALPVHPYIVYQPAAPRNRFTSMRHRYMSWRFPFVPLPPAS